MTPYRTVLPTRTTSRPAHRSGRARRLVRPTGLAALALGLGLAAGCTGDQAADETDASGTASVSPDTGAESPEAGAESPGAADPQVADGPGADTRYCELLATDFGALFDDIQGPDDVDQAMSVIGEIVDEAPTEVSDEWQTMAGALDQMQQALAAAAQLQQDATSGELSDKQLAKRTEKLMQQMQALDTPENNAAGDAVAEHASEYCGIDLQ